ncbi:hypothetical protein RhiXN_10661 [Rhizoctonia solani]|uniref:Uncharacterized protein n=1 Tax=Rhizoctonia solani TaxID=456999 RepID=A0A8H8P4T6_9AGAM|nr:uncharacterized protein RhiXN_10661 [Rhizoctonia solani]QRW24337.1 hypothetical protein RhiXN_10661 [Rhizoctonia solani]
MSERASISKDPVLPPSAPRRLASRSPLTSRVRLRNPGRASIDRESSSALGLGRHVPPSFAYPTPGTGRKNGTQRSLFVFKKNVRVLDLEPASAPRHDLQGICNANVKDSDSPTEGSITTSRPVFSKVVGTNSAKDTESLQRNDKARTKAEARVVRRRTQTRTTRKEATKCWVLLEGEKVLFQPKSEVPSYPMHPPAPILPGARNAQSCWLRKTPDLSNTGKWLYLHALKSMLDLCALNQANDAGELVAKFDDAGKAVWFVNGILVPHFDRGFDKEWEKWGTSAIDVIRDQSRWDPSDVKYLESVTNAKWRVVVKNGVYATMLRVWKKYQGDAGEGREWLDKRRMLNRRQSRKDAKAKSRMAALKGSGLEVGDSNLPAIPVFNRPNIQTRTIRAAVLFRNPSTESQRLLVQFLGALDIAYKDNKKRCGNQKVTRRDFDKVNNNVPKLKKGKIPAWAVDKEWERTNPKACKQLAKRIDSDLDEIPQEEKFNKFIDRYTPQPREYLSPLPLPLPLPSPSPLPSPLPSRSNAPADTPVPSITLATQSRVIEAAPVTTPTLLAADICHPPGNAVCQPPLDVPTALLVAPSHAPGSGQSWGTAMHTGASMGFGTNVASAAPKAPTFSQPAFPHYGYQPGFQPGYLYGQPGRNGGTQAHIPIDPALQGETSGRLYPLNSMPPPPELHEQEAAAAQYSLTAQPNIPGQINHQTPDPGQPKRANQAWQVAAVLYTTVMLFYGLRKATFYYLLAKGA